MKSMSTPKIRPEPAENPTMYHVEYAVELDDGRQVYPVTTVFRTQAPSGTEAEILAIADAAVLPGVILQDRQSMLGLPEVPPPPDPLDMIDWGAVEQEIQAEVNAVKREARQQERALKAAEIRERVAARIAERAAKAAEG